MHINSRVPSFLANCTPRPAAPPPAACQSPSFLQSDPVTPLALPGWLAAPAASFGGFFRHVGGLIRDRLHEAPAAPTPPVTGGRKAPDFALPRTQDGRTVRLSDSHGKLRVVNFFASFCPFSRSHAEELARYQRAYGDDVEVIGVAMRERNGTAGVNDMARRLGLNYTTVMGHEAIGHAFGGVPSLPTTYLVDREGHIVKAYKGANARRQLAADLQRLS